MKQGLLFICFSTFSLVSLSQDYHTIGHYHFEYSPDNAYEYNNQNSVDIEENELTLSIPILRENGDAYVTGFEFSKTRMYPKFNQPDTASDSLYTGSYQFFKYRFALGYNKVWSEKFKGVFMFIPSLSSDMEEITSRDLQWGAVFLFTKVSNPKFTWKYGLYVNTEYLGLFVVPLIGWDWKIGEKWRMFGVLPRAMTIQHKFNDRFRSGIKFEAPGLTYDIKKENFTDGSGQPVNTYVQNLKNSLYLYGEVYLTKSIVFQARVGHSVFRFIRLYDSDETTIINVWGVNVGRKRNQMEVSGFRDFSDGILLNASLHYRFNLE